MSDDRGKEAEALFEKMEEAVGSAIRAVESANGRVKSTLANLSDPERRKAIAEKAQQEVAANPGLLEEIERLLDRRGEYDKNHNP